MLDSLIDLAGRKDGVTYAARDSFQVVFGLSSDPLLVRHSPGSADGAIGLPRSKDAVATGILLRWVTN